MSFSIALSGLSASNTELGNISNNIANVSTTGYKVARTEFAAVYNANQAGGVDVVATSQNFDKNGTVNSTGRSLDMAISGSGFFITQDSSAQTLYTRSGVFNLASNGAIVTNTGSTLQGYSVNDNFELETGIIGDIIMNTSPIAAQATTEFSFVANLDASEEVITAAFDSTDSDTFNHSYSTLVYDSQGNQHTLNQYFVKTADNTWDVYAELGGSLAAGPVTLGFDLDGSLASGGAYTLTTTNLVGVEQLSIEVDLKGTTQYASDYAVNTNQPNGYSAGEFVSTYVESDGQIFASYSNGKSQLQGQVVLANFVSPQELIKMSDTAWLQTFSSGSPIINAPGTGVLGEITSGALEGSNVDLTTELVSLMTAQRNYQANTKTISTYDQLTQALFNAV